jgi:diguanylate cyclase (GGDEF)-like protein
MFGNQKAETGVQMQMDTPLRPDAAGFREELSRLLGEKKPRGVVLKLHLENFKLFNDTFGFAYGERFLKEAVAFLQSLQKGPVFRLGGVEFALILDRHRLDEAQTVAGEISLRFEETWRINDMDYMCSVSIGMLSYPDHASTAEEALSRLDKAVSAASERGMNMMAVYNLELHKKLSRRNEIARELSEALAAGTLELRYRPTYHVEKGVFTRADCYFRMVSANLGIIGAAELIPVAEDSGQICMLNQYAIRRTCEEIRRLMEANIEFDSIAVPISPVQFLQKAFVQEMEAVLAEFGIPAGNSLLKSRKARCSIPLAM